MKVNFYPFKEKDLFNQKVCTWIINFSILFWTLFTPLPKKCFFRFFIYLFILLPEALLVISQIIMYYLTNCDCKLIYCINLCQFKWKFPFPLLKKIDPNRKVGSWIIEFSFLFWPLLHSAANDRFFVLFFLLLIWFPEISLLISHIIIIISL